MSIGDRDPERQAEELAESLLERGAPFALEVLETDPDTGPHLLALLDRWYSGATLSQRADEPELRAQVAHGLYEARPDVPLFGRFLAAALLALPPGHADRDLALAREMTLDGLQLARDEGDADEELIHLALALDGDLAPDADVAIARGDALAAEHPGRAAGAFLTAAQGHAMRRLTEAEEERDDAAVERWAAVVNERSTAAGEDDLDAAVALQTTGRWAEAAERWGALVAAHDLVERPIQQFAFEQARCLVRAERHADAVAVLTRTLPFAEHSYIAAVRPEDVDETGERVADLALLLALAHAREGAWGAALQAIDRRYALRLRYLASLRDIPGGPDVLALLRETEDAIRCGAPAAEVAALLERHRAALAAVAAPIPQSPSVAELAAALDPGEAVAVLAQHPRTLLTAVVLPGDRDQPTGSRIDDEWTRDHWLELMTDEDEAPGWVSVLSASLGGEEAPDAFLALEWLRNGADDAIGRSVRAILDEHAVRRLTIVCDELPAMVPWAAVPSFADLDVVSAPSLAHVAFERGRAAAPRSALFVVNPTGDAHASDLSATSAARTLAGSGIAVAELAGPEAREAGVVAALDGRGMLHFAGHGRWGSGYGGLELNPGETGAADFAAWVAGATGWHDEGGEDDEAGLYAERWADVEQGGRLHERSWADGPRTDRWLERPDSTLLATYRGEEPQRVSELWSALDIVLGAPFRTCRMCVLTACESAVRSGSGDPARPDLPAALAFAGASTVVGTLWPIEDRFAALWTERFYAALAAALAGGSGRVDVAALVREVSDELAAMPLEEATDRLLALAAASPDPLLRFVLEAEARTLPEEAFADPWSWAAFYVTGAPVIDFQETG